MTASPARSLTAKFLRQAIAVLAIGVPFAALPGLAQAASVPAIPLYMSNLDTQTNWGGSTSSPTTLDQITANYSAAVLNGLIVPNGSGGLTLSEYWNTQTPGSPSFTPVVAGMPSANAFAYEYTFTVGQISNAQGTFVSNFGGLTDVSLALYSAAPSLYQMTPTNSPGNPGTNPQGAGAGPLAVGVLSTMGSTAGEYVLQMANLTAGNTYYLTVTGELAPHAGSGNFFGLAEVSTVPLPGALLMFGSALAGMGGLFGRRRLAEVGRKFAHGATSGMAVAAAAFGLIVTALIPGGARAATVPVDIYDAVAYPPPSGGVEYIPLSGQIVSSGSGVHQMLRLMIPGTPTVSASQTTSFVFDYQLDLAQPAFLNASISQLGTTMKTGTSFELFSGMASASGAPLTSSSANFLAASIVGNTPTTAGQLVLDYSGLKGKGMATGEYFLQVTGGLANNMKIGSVSGTATLSPVPLPTALLLFGSAIGGLAIVERFGGRKERV